MWSPVSTKGRITTVLAAVATLAALAAVVLTGTAGSRVLVEAERAPGTDSAGQGAGPLRTVGTETGVIFPAPQGSGLDHGTWSATAGSFLLCSPTPDITLTAVEPANDIDGAAFIAMVRQFTIAYAANDTPVLGGYGTPPVIGGQDGSDQSHLTGTLDAAAGHTIAVPACAATDGTPGTDATELLFTVRADEQGAEVDGVDVSYEADGRQHLLHIPVTMMLCGSKHHDRDC
ncbi:MAG: hypothetical protein JWN22_419 [Nocardioides sp.]|jgi:hypothetical protein|nr:hypothetical protein [Nocardioides sp.]